MKKLLILAIVIILCSSFGCKNVDVEEGIVKSTQPDYYQILEKATKSQSEQEDGQKYNDTSNVAVLNANKSVISEQKDIEEYVIIETEYEYSPENNEKAVEHCEENTVENGTTLNDKTYVYATEYLKTLFNPKGDKGICVFNDNNKQYLIDVLALCPTEAIRKTEKGYYLVYDTDDNLRVFAWFELLNDDPWYQQIGYSIYLGETLSYSDFEHIEIGDNALEVEEIDPKIVDMNLRFHREREEPEHTQIGIENGFAPKSIHLLTDGVIIFIYGRNEDGFFVSNIEFHEDFTIDTVAGPQCCKIDPLDYVTQG